MEYFLSPLHKVAGVVFIRIETVECRGQTGIGIVRPKFVTGDLLAHEAVIRLVAVE